MYVETLKKISRSLIDAPCTALIAGGAVRDIDNGKPFKDIDIFCFYDHEDQILEMRGFALDDLSLTFERDLGDGNEYEQNFNGIDKVYEYQLPREFPDSAIPVQLIFQKHKQQEDIIKQTTERFDLNICQIALGYDDLYSKFVIYKAEGYKRDKQNGVITLTPHGEAVTGERRAKTRQRARRISNKLNFRTDLSWDRVANPYIVWEEELPRLDRAQWGQVINNAQGMWNLINRAG